MTLTLADQPAPPALNDRWSDVQIPPTLAHAGRVLAGDAPTIDRPRALTADRAALVLLTLTTLGASVPLGVMVADDAVTASALRSLSLAIALLAFLTGAGFGAWALRQRTTIDDLRWRSFRRPAWGGWWSVVWAITPAVALVAFAVVEALTDGLLWTAAVFLALLVARLLSLRALGTNMKRVVFGARRWGRAGALAIAIADYLLIVIVWSTLLEPQVDRDVLRLAASVLPFALLLAGAFTLSYAKRVERWILEWWDNRWGCTEQVALDRLGAVGALNGEPDEFTARRLLPTAPLRLLVVASYLVLAATTAWSGWTIWTLRDDLDSARFTTSADRLDEVSFWFLGALVLMQVCHAAWCIVQACNARRCTLEAPSALGTSVLFLPGPAILVLGIVFLEDELLLAVVVALAVVVNLVCWALSFSLLSRMLQTLGRSSGRIAAWGAVVALHWALLFGVRPVVLVDDPDTFAGLVLVVAALDAVIFLTAAVYAEIAMREVARATRGFDQIRRRPVSRQRRRHRAPGGILVTATPATQRSHP